LDFSFGTGTGVGSGYFGGQQEFSLTRLEAYWYW